MDALRKPLLRAVPTPSEPASPTATSKEEATATGRRQSAATFKGAPGDKSQIAKGDDGKAVRRGESKDAVHAERDDAFVNSNEKAADKAAPTAQARPAEMPPTPGVTQPRDDNHFYAMGAKSAKSAPAASGGLGKMGGDMSYMSRRLRAGAARGRQATAPGGPIESKKPPTAC